MNFSTWQARCSKIADVIPSLTGKGGLIIGNKTELRKIYVQEITQYRKQITSKYFEKGNFCEEDAIDLLQATLYKGRLILKNKIEKTNEFIRGTCDCVVDDLVWDIKNAYDRITFSNASLTDDYFWQGIGYMWLWGKRKFKVFYCLVNMPEHMLIAEERKIFYAGMYATQEDANYKAACEAMRAYHNYDEMPLEERFKVFDVELNDAHIEHLKKGIGLARGYLTELYTNDLARIKANRVMMGIEGSKLDETHVKPEDNSNPLLNFLKKKNE